ncbi:MNIO family bufferin maturase [Luteolibacter soli]|uniref:DUF692 domain-containing protein n=1 Tax=Luteolibacter soli TaxID=3135280 RepID=A0ABU9AZ98_9BACT
MSGSRFTAGVELATGIGLRVPHYNHILAEKPAVGWFEIISENYMVEGGRALAVLDQILDQYRVVQHGVGMYPGDAGGVKFDHLRRLKRLVRRTKTPWLSDHLCWGSVDGSMSHDLLPIPFTFEAARKTAENLRIIQDFLEVPLAMENVSSYGEFNGNEMTEWEFLAEVTELADVGILLDVNNIYVSSVNNGFDAMEYVNFVPPERVAQIHIAGHSRYERFIVDTHDHPVVDPVWKLYERAIERCGPVATLLEWDGRIPSFDEVWTEAKKSEAWRESALAKKEEHEAA